nr:uncharacterized protein LOC109148017 isoform X2 [Ipomoea batatas]
MSTPQYHRKLMSLRTGKLHQRRELTKKINPAVAAAEQCYSVNIIGTPCHFVTGNCTNGGLTELIAVAAAVMVVANTRKVFAAKENVDLDEVSTKISSEKAPAPPRFSSPGSVKQRSISAGKKNVAGGGERSIAGGESEEVSFTGAVQVCCA